MTTQEQVEEDLMELERVNAEIQKARSRLRDLIDERKRLHRYLGLPDIDQEDKDE